MHLVRTKPAHIYEKKTAHLYAELAHVPNGDSHLGHGKKKLQRVEILEYFAIQILREIAFLRLLEYLNF